jgi:hypothetical protein
MPLRCLEEDIAGASDIHSSDGVREVGSQPSLTGLLGGVVEMGRLLRVDIPTKACLSGLP